MRIRRRLTLYGVFVTALTMIGFGLLLTALGQRLRTAGSRSQPGEFRRRAACDVAGAR